MFLRLRLKAQRKKKAKAVERAGRWILIFCIVFLFLHILLRRRLLSTLLYAFGWWTGKRAKKRNSLNDVNQFYCSDVIIPVAGGT